MEFNFLNDGEKKLLALFLKRLCFNHVLDCPDGNDDKDQAYEILDVISILRKKLADIGFNPR